MRNPKTASPETKTARQLPPRNSHSVSFLLHHRRMRGASDRAAPKLLTTARAEIKEGDFQFIPLAGAEQWLKDAKGYLETNKAVEAELLLNAFHELQSFQAEEIKNLQREVEGLEPAL